MTLQTIRFIGGTKNNCFEKVAPSTDVIGTDKTIELKERPQDRDFKKGDRLLCVKAYPHWLTEGKIYEVIDAVGGTVTVIGDKGALSGPGDFYVSSGWFRLNEIAPKGQRYTRQLVSIRDGLSQYAEVCFVLDGMDSIEAAGLLSNALQNARHTLRVPVVVVTKPLPSRESSLVHGLRYDPGSLTLDVVMKKSTKEGAGRGDSYRYTGVPTGIIGMLLTAPSLGSAYGNLIKGKYDSVKLS